jgi:putative methionine-R-sulfoxide reductase with GAF domain
MDNKLVYIGFLWHFQGETGHTRFRVGAGICVPRLESRANQPISNVSGPP